MNAIGVPTSFYVLLAATIVAAKSMLWKIPFVPAVNRETDLSLQSPDFGYRRQANNFGLL